MTAHAEGLRATELRELQLYDIDSVRMCLRADPDKGNNDRYVPFSPRLPGQLRAHCLGIAIVHLGQTIHALGKVVIRFAVGHHYVPPRLMGGTHRIGTSDKSPPDNIMPLRVERVHNNRFTTMSVSEPHSKNPASGSATVMKIDASDTTLEGADLHRAFVFRTNLPGTDLHNVDFRDADLRDSDLRWSDIRGARFEDAQYHWCSKPPFDDKVAKLRGMRKVR